MTGFIVAYFEFLGVVYGLILAFFLFACFMYFFVIVPCEAFKNMRDPKHPDYWRRY